MMFIASILVMSLQAFAGPLPAPLVPDDSTTGILCTTSDPDFTEFRYDEKIPYCERNVSPSEKSRIYDHYGIPRNCRHEYTIDHFYPLSLGGNNERGNLWPEHREIKHSRQNLEMRLYQALRAGRVSQRAALDEIREFKMHPRVEKIISGSYCDLDLSHFRDEF